MHYKILFACMLPLIASNLQLPLLSESGSAYSWLVSHTCFLMLINPLPVFSLNKTLFPIVYSLTFKSMKTELLTLLLLQTKINSQHILTTHTTSINQHPVDMFQLVKRKPIKP